MKLIIHCGSSKNGSTALQNYLLFNKLKLQDVGVVALSCLYEDDVFVSDRETYYVDKLKIYSCSPNFIKFHKNITTSFGIFYEIYKQCIFKSDSIGLRNLLSKLNDAINSANKNDASVVIISAEAFETSLCLKDPLFKRLVRNFSKSHDVQIIYYMPQRAKHVIASWLQWGWIDRVKYSDWLLNYSNKTNFRDFFKKTNGQVGYFANLLNTVLWFDYWRLDERFNIRIIENELDVVSHFFNSIIFIDRKALNVNFDKSPTTLNKSWPKSLIVLFPLFFDFFCQDYEKFEVIRNLLVDKCDDCKDNLLSYNDIQILTGEALAIYFSVDEKFDVYIVNTQIAALFSELKTIFEKIDVELFSYLLLILSETIFHQNARLLCGRQLND